MIFPGLHVARIYIPPPSEISGRREDKRKEEIGDITHNAIQRRKPLRIKLNPSILRLMSQERRERLGYLNLPTRSAASTAPASSTPTMSPSSAGPAPLLRTLRHILEVFRHAALPVVGLLVYTSAVTATLCSYARLQCYQRSSDALNLEGAQRRQWRTRGARALATGLERGEELPLKNPLAHVAKLVVTGNARYAAHC